MVNDLREKARNHLKYQVLDIGHPTSLTFLFWRWLILLLLLGLHHSVKNLRIDLDVLEVNISRKFKGVDLSNCSFDSLTKLMGPNALKNPVILVSQDNISLRVEFENKMISKGLSSKGQHHHSLNSDLPDRFNTF